MGITTADVAAPAACVISRLRVAMGTFVALEAEAGSRHVAERAVASAWDAITTVERVMHPDRPGSDLNLLARCSVGAAVPIHPWTWDVLRLCHDLHAATGGAFDPCLDEQPGRFCDVVLIRPSLVRLRSKVRVDLGGIAKGFAVDRGLEAMKRAGCVAGLVNAGGDLAVFGARARTVYCGRPPQTAVIALKDAALASSDTDSVDHPAEHRGYYHGSTRAGRVSGQAVVTAPLAAWADALTKCVLLMQGAPLQALLARVGARLLSAGAPSAS
jgi:FAD:protein FMN transferase